MRRLHATVGTQPELELDLPEHLLELRDAFASGRLAEVLEFLEEGQPAQ